MNLVDFSAVVNAAETGHLDQIQRALEGQPAQLMTSIEAVTRAILFSPTPVLRVLDQDDPTLNANRASLVQMAAQSHHPDAVKVLLTRGRLDQDDFDQAVICAVMSGDVATVAELLRDYGPISPAGCFYVCNKLETYLQKAVKNHNPLEIMQGLMIARMFKQDEVVFSEALQRSIEDAIQMTKGFLATVT